MNDQIAYDPRVFDQPDIPRAMAIILTPEEGVPTQVRWMDETAYTMELIDQHLSPKGKFVLDYGCGIGRLALELVQRDCDVVGVDTSVNMRALAPAYVQSERFLVCHPYFLDRFDRKFDAAIAVWTLQHCHNVVEADLVRLQWALKPGGKLFVLNNVNRVVPTSVGWVDDGLDLQATLGKAFNKGPAGKLSPARVSPLLAQGTWWGVFTKWAGIA